MGTRSWLDHSSSKAAEGSRRIPGKCRWMSAGPHQGWRRVMACWKAEPESKWATTSQPCSRSAPRKRCRCSGRTSTSASVLTRSTRYSPGMLA
ncbi:Uncharacterised protein [Mycobacteroides abscessus subsp. abscessus]|nr:Uncharacterised protein [Mycobacteroides abscessus subsp. abscessus]